METFLLPDEISGEGARCRTSGCTRGGVRVLDGDWISRAARVIRVVRRLNQRTQNSLHSEESRSQQNLSKNDER